MSDWQAGNNAPNGTSYYLYWIDLDARLYMCYKSTLGTCTNNGHTSSCSVARLREPLHHRFTADVTASPISYYYSSYNERTRQTPLSSDNIPIADLKAYVASILMKTHNPVICLVFSDYPYFKPF